jgi:hypothetical protein
MSIPNDLKKSIIKEWLTEFPELSPYVQNRLYKIVGPIVAGIEILKLPRADDYRPTFTCYPLWKSSEKDCLEEPLLLQELNNKRGFQLDIPYMEHKSLFQEAIDCTRKQILIGLEGDVTLNNLYNAINSQFSYILVKSSPVSQAKLYECKLFAALYVDDGALIKKILDDINQTSKSWAPNLFEWKFGKVDKWIGGLKEKINHRQEFLNQITANKRDKKLEKLKSSELIG